MKNVTVRLEESTVQRLDEVAENNGDSRSEYVRNLILVDLDDETTSDDSQEKVDRLRDELDETRETLTERRVEAARLEAENKRLESDLERIRDERDSAKARYHESQGKLKVHNSEKSGVLSRISSLFSDR